MAITVIIHAVLVLALLRVILDAAEVPTVKLNNAARSDTNMPAVGIGTGGYSFTPTTPGEIWSDSVAEKAVTTWFKVGGRRVDTAYSYHDQKGIGRAIAASQVPREELFIVSKVCNPHGPPAYLENMNARDIYAMGYNDTLMQMEPILKTLQVDYVDLLLIHWPGPPGNSTDPLCQGDPPTWRECRQSTWRAMEELYHTGKARAIGVSNYERNHLEEILDLGGLIPAVNQVEFHPYWHEDDLVAFCKANNIVYNGYSPLGCPDWAPTSHNWSHSLLQEPTVLDIAKAHQCTPAQVVLQWEWQQGVIVNPRTEKENHMIENLSFFDIQLTDEEIRDITAITPPKNAKVCSNPHNTK